MEIKILPKSNALLRLFLLVLALGITTSMMAQTNTVSGQILDENGEGLPGASVIEKGTTNGTTTDIEGNFRINVPQTAVLTISFVGYETQEIEVGNQSTINVSMDTDSELLGEVVVVGYGTQKKATLTGSVETVSNEVFTDRAVTNTAALLQGQTPGLVVTRGSAQPGREDWDFQIRGATSVNGGEPLIVIDGAPTVNMEAFYSMNPDDIDNISVLKDGAAAIYGSRASNGVILVTTKKGSGKMKLNFSSNTRLNTIGIMPQSATMQEYATVWLEAADQDRVPLYWGWVSRENLERMQTGEPGIYPTQYWGDMYMEPSQRADDMWGNSYSHQQNVSLSGSSDRSNYRFSAGWAEDRGMLQTAYDGKEQYNLRLNYDYDVTDWLELETSVSYFHIDIENPSTGLDREAAAYDPAIWPAKTPDGFWYANFNTAGNRNSVASSSDGGKEFDSQDQLKAAFAATIKLTKDLSFRGTASFDNVTGDNMLYKTTVKTYTWDGVETSANINSTSFIEQEKTKITYQIYGGFLNYNKAIGDHDFSAMLGLTAEKRRNNRVYGYRRGFEDFGVYDLNLGANDQLVQAQGGSGNWGLYSYIGRFNYGYKGKYLFEISGRRDGSSRFAEGHQWSNFGYGSIGWVLTEESFLQGLPVLSFLKLRASYGETGNQVGIGEFDYLSTIAFNTAVFGSTPANNQNTAKVSGLTSATRTWERVGIATVGLDFKLFENKLFGQFDYFEKVNDGMLINVNYPQTLGGNAPKSNSGELKTTGWEFILGYANNAGQFKYSATFNVSNTTNKLVSMEGVSTYSQGLNNTVEGYPLRSYFLHQTEGFFTSDEEVDDYYAAVGNGGTIPSYANDQLRLRPGDTKKTDLDGNGIIESNGSTELGNGDIKYMGDADPHQVYGLDLKASWKGFDFQTFFQGVFNQNVVRGGYMPYPFYLVWTNQTPAYIGKTWTPQNTGAEFPRMTAQNTLARWNYGNNDFMMVNNRYIRLKTLTLGYTFDDNVLEKIKLDRLRVYFSANDVFEITSLKDGYDPEYGESTNEPYPFKRTWSLGLNLTF